MVVARARTLDLIPYIESLRPFVVELESRTSPLTEAELESIAIDDLAEIDSRYDLGGAPPLAGDEPLDDMWAYTRAQLKTQGHFNGEGECPVDGVEHSHE